MAKLDKLQTLPPKFRMDWLRNTWLFVFETNKYNYIDVHIR